MPIASLRVWPGAPYPLGATWDGIGVNFALFSEHATRVELCLFNSAADEVESLTIPLPEQTDMIWHGYLPDELGAFFDIIHQDPVLSQVKLIAEPWDLGEGGYQVGNFPTKWTEWNGKYRDTVRRFWRGDGGVVSELATRLSGSSDLYEQSGRRPYESINFVTAHDGFTLNDLVSYNEKHNEADERGERVVGDTLLVLFNAGAAPEPFLLPDAAPMGGWDALLDTADPWIPARRLRAGDLYELQPRSMAVLRLERLRPERAAGLPAVAPGPPTPRLWRATFG